MGSDAFISCANLNYINFSNAIKEIGCGAFYCSGLMGIEAEGVSGATVVRYVWRLKVEKDKNWGVMVEEN